MKPNINPVEVHPQLSHNGHPVDGASNLSLDSPLSTPNTA